jgi:hypothetical protein
MKILLREIAFYLLILVLPELLLLWSCNGQTLPLWAYVPPMPLNYVHKTVSGSEGALRQDYPR